MTPFVIRWPVAVIHRPSHNVSGDLLLPQLPPLLLLRRQQRFERGSLAKAYLDHDDPGLTPCVVLPSKPVPRQNFMTKAYEVPLARIARIGWPITSLFAE